MPLPDLSQLPPWAVIAFGISLAIIFGLAYLGERQGKRAPQPIADGAQRVLGAVIDNKKADELIAAFNKVAGELADNTEVWKELTQTLRANTAAAISLGGDITDARTDVRELGREIVKLAARMQ